MNNGLTEINEIIAKHLPAQIGKVLQERLGLVDKLERRTSELEALNITLNSEKSTIRTKLETAHSELEKHATLDVREAELTKREIYLELTLARADADHAKDKTNALYGLVGTIFKNPVVSETVIKSGNNSASQTTNGMTTNGNYESHTETTNTTRTLA